MRNKGRFSLLHRLPDCQHLPPDQRLLQGHSLDHGLPCKSVPGSHVEDASLVNGQVADQAEAVDCLVAIHGDCVDKGGEAQAIAKGERNDAGTGQERLSCHIHNGHLQ